MAAVMLLASLSLNNVWRLGSMASAAAAVAMSRGGEHPTLLRVSSAGNVYGTLYADEDPDGGKPYSENSSETNNYDSYGGVGDDGDDDDEDEDDGGDDSYTDSNNSREREDQLDQDDPGKIHVLYTPTVDSIRVGRCLTFDFA